MAGFGPPDVACRTGQATAARPMAAAAITSDTTMLAAPPDRRRRGGRRPVTITGGGEEVSMAVGSCSREGRWQRRPPAVRRA